jgi:hypothetical protein
MILLMTSTSSRECVLQLRATDMRSSWAGRLSWKIKTHNNSWVSTGNYQSENSFSLKLVVLQLQALKYRWENGLTKCSMTLSLGRTHVLWCPTDVRWPWVQFGLEISIYECKQINISTIWKSHLSLGNKFASPTVKTSHLITHFQLTFYTLLWFSI